METPYIRISLSTDGVNIRHGENKNNRKYTKKNPPTVAKISCYLRGQDIMEYYMKQTKQNKP